MRVLTIGNMYPPRSRGGYEIAWQSAVRFLCAHGHDVRVVTTTFGVEESSNRSEDDHGAAVFRELDWYWRDDDWPRFSGLGRLRVELLNARAFDRHCREHRPDVICWWAMGGMSLSLIERARRRGIPMAFVVCDDWLQYGPEVDAWLRATRRFRCTGAVLGRLLGLPTGLDLDDLGPWLFCSETVQSRALETGLHFAMSRVGYPGVDRTLFQEAEPQEWRWRLLYAGRLDPRKGIDLAIEALGFLPPAATLRVSGTGNSRYLAGFRRLSADLGVADRVTFASDPRSSLSAIYADSDVVLFPVLWVEPWGLVPLETMAVGRPVVASGRGGSGEYLRDGVNCLLFDPEAGGHALAAQIRRLAEDRELRHRLRIGGFETIDRFREDAFDHAIAALLEDAVRRSESRR